MTDYTKIEALCRRLISERRKLVETAAPSGALPPDKLLAYLADLDSAVVAVEAVLADRTGLQEAATMINGRRAIEAFA